MCGVCWVHNAVFFVTSDELQVAAVIFKHLHILSNQFFLLHDTKFIVFVLITVKFLEFVKPFCAVLPEIQKPERKVCQCHGLQMF